MAKLTYPGHIRKRGATWQLIVSVNGERRTRTVEAKTKGEAADAITTWYAELTGAADRKARGVPVDWTMSDLLDDWERNVVGKKDTATRTQYEGFARRVRWYLTHRLGHDPLVRDFRLAQCTLFLDWRGTVEFDRKGLPLPATPSARTMQKERFLLRNVLKRAKKLEIVDGNPVDDTDSVSVRKRQPVLATDDQISRLEDEMRGPMRQLYVCCLDETAGRCGSEVLWLRWEDVDWERRTITLWDDPDAGHRTKGRKGRELPLSERLYSRLREHEAAFRLMLYAGKRSPWVFHHTRGVPHARPGDRITSLSKAFAAAKKRAGIDGKMHQHDLRHRRLTRLAADGHPLEKIRVFAGHADIKTTQGYLHLAVEDLRSLVEETHATVSPEQLAALLESEDPDVREAAVTLIRALRGEAEKKA